MKKEKGILFGVLVMMFFFIAGVVGTVSAAGVDQTVQLKLEVNLLEQINQLNLTNEQIDKILPILKNVQTIIQTANTELQAVLAKEKELLLQRKTNEAEALQVEKRVIREKAALQVKTVLVDLQTILTPEQLKKLQSVRNLTNLQRVEEARGVKRNKDEAYLHGSTTTGMIKMGTPNGVVIVQKKPDTQKKDGKVQDTLRVQLSVETAKMILQKQEQRLVAMEAQAGKLDEKSKVVWNAQIAQIKANIEELKMLIAKSTDGTIAFQPKQMGQGMFVSDSVKIQMSGKTNKGNSQIIISTKDPDRMGQVLTGSAPQMGARLQSTEMLSMLIKVLEELRSAQ